jgi:hypothetical protein
VVKHQPAGEALFKLHKLGENINLATASKPLIVSSLVSTGQGTSAGLYEF